MSARNAKAIELEMRIVSFASDIVRISANLTATPEGKHVSTQILRSGTAAAANYGEAASIKTARGGTP
jgi:four helix bundle protein